MQCASRHSGIAGPSATRDKTAANFFHQNPGLAISFVSIYLSGSEELEVSGESLIEPQVTPPFRTNDVAEPLVRQFMRDNLCGQLNTSDGGAFRIDEQEAFTVCIFGDSNICLDLNL
jgi:hypothetical protein